MIEQQLHHQLSSLLISHSKGNKINRTEIRVMLDAALEQIFLKIFNSQIASNALTTRIKINRYLVDNPTCENRAILMWCLKFCINYENYFGKNYIDYSHDLNLLLKKEIPHLLEIISPTLQN